MIKIDLITGFLGSGKTTFIKKYAKHLMDKGHHIGILENDFGAINVDMMLLQELMGDYCDLEMISGGCDKETHRRRFRTKLIAMAMSGYDRIIVEPSGIYDIDEFFDVLHDEPLDQWYEVGSVIAIVDAQIPDKLSKEADYLLASEAADAGRIILSHTDEASPEQAKAAVKHINRALKQIQCRRHFDENNSGEVLMKSTMQLTKEDMDALMTCGYVSEDFQKMDIGDDEGFKSLFFMNMDISREQLARAAAVLMNDKEIEKKCGHIYRIKGFIQEADGSWLQINAIHGQTTVEPAASGQSVIIVIGEHLDEESIRRELNGSNRQ